MADQSLFDNVESNCRFNRYLLQVNRIKLQDYIQHALVAPDSYFDDEIEKDIQSKNPNFLVLSDGYIKELDEHQILLELILTDSEKEKLRIMGEVCYFDFPLPLTRIKKIYTQDNDVKQHVLINIQNNEKGFLPKELMDVYLKKEKPIFDLKEYSALEDGTVPHDYQDNVTKYDKRMGMFAFMKNTNLYYHETTCHISNYSDNYFSALSSYLEKKLVDGVGFSQLKDVFDKYDDFKTLLNSNHQINEPFLEKIAEKIADREMKEIFLGLLKENATRKTLPLLLEKDLGLYLVGLVYYFRKKDANKKDSFKIDIASLIPFEAAEVSLAVLGIYLGYTNLRPSESIAIKDETFKKIFGTSFNMKFQLENKLDYITIESIYNYCFNEEKGFEFQYLNYPKRSKKYKLPSDKEFKRMYEVVYEKTFFNTLYLKLKKLSFGEISQKRLQQYPDEIKLGEHHILSYVAKYFPDKVHNINGLSQVYCTKTELMKILMDELSAEQYRELECLFEADNNDI
jgi:hypothetical protein